MSKKHHDEPVVPVDENVEESPAAEKTAEDEIAELKDQLLRTMAEMENLRKRSQREKEEAIKYACTNFARDMLAVSDNLRRALDVVSDQDKESMSSTVKGMLEGVEMSEKELLTIFKRHGIEKIQPVIGEPFSADYHQAMFEVESTEHEPGMVVQILQTGYKFHDRLLRAAMVGVSKKAK